MSKQKNKKFKKAKVKVISNSIEAITSDVNQTLEVTATATVKTPDKYIDSAAEYAHVRKDVRIILFTILLLAILIVGFYFVSTKTTVFTTFGDWIYKIFNIQTL